MTSSSPTTLEATSVFYQARPALRLFRSALAMAQRLWPALAVRLALRLFATPLPPRWPLRRHRAWDPAWRIERWAFEDASLTVYSHATVGAPGSVVLLVHGWGGHAGQMLPLADTLARQGLWPVLLELPAHGRSDGRISTLPQFARAIDYAAARLAQEEQAPRAVVAHSLAANAAAYVASRGLHASRLVLVAPPASPREYTRLFAQVFGLSEATRAAMQRRIEAREGVLMPQFEPQVAGPRIRMPVLVVHDRGDRINPFADGEAFARAILHARLLATEGLGHRKLLKDEAVLREVAAFLT